MPGRDRERAERREQGHEGRALLVCRLESVLLAVVGLEPERRERRAAGRRSPRRRAAPAPPRLATKTSLTRPGLPSSRCAGGERHEQALVGRARSAVADDVAHAHDPDRAPGEDAQRVAAAGAEARGGLRVQIDLVRRELRERHRAASARDRAEAARAAPDRRRTASTRGSFCREVRSCTATGSTITGATPSTRPDAAAARATRAASRCEK